MSVRSDPWGSCLVANSMLLASARRRKHSLILSEAAVDQDWSSHSTKINIVSIAAMHTPLPEWVNRDRSVSLEKQPMTAVALKRTSAMLALPCHL